MIRATPSIVYGDTTLAYRLDLRRLKLFFQMLFTGIPLVSATAFLPSLLSASSLIQGLLSCLGILSLLTTAYTMRNSPLHHDRKGKKPTSVEDQRRALVRTALVPANVFVCLVLTAGYFLVDADSSYTTRPVLYLIPSGECLGIRVHPLLCCWLDQVENCLTPHLVQPCSQSSWSHGKQCFRSIFQNLKISSTSTKVHKTNHDYGILTSGGIA